MAVTLKNHHDGAPEIQVLGRFDFTSHREFREACKSIGRAPRCVVDMRGTTYVDSSALGMMLLLRENVETIRIVGASPQVRKVLEIANFQRLFELD